MKESSDFLSSLFPVAKTHRTTTNYCNEILQEALVIRKESGFLGRKKSGVPSIIEPVVKDYELVPEFEQILSPRSVARIPSKLTKSAVPFIPKASALPPPPPPDK